MIGYKEIENFMKKNGWEINGTGGGCLAWMKSAGVDGGYMLITNVEGGNTPPPGERALLGFYNEDGQPLGEYIHFDFNDLITGKIVIG